MNELVCWQCGASLASLSLPFSRRDTCPACGADLHVCRLCEFFAINMSKSCREPVVDEVRDKERANFCDYFQPRPSAYNAEGQAREQQAKAALDELFGGSMDRKDSAEESNKALERLFKKNDD